MFASKIESISQRPAGSTGPLPGRNGTARGALAAVLAAGALSGALLSAPACADPIPAAAAAAGYRMETLAVDSFSSRSVDMKKTYAPGYQMYFFNFEGMTPDPSLTTLNADGSLTSSTTKTGWSAYGSFLTSAAAINSGPGFRGTAFGGGGYFEASLAFNSAAVNVNNGAWPAWWSMALEHMILKGDQWPGQRPGFEHYIEPDFFEYDTGVKQAYGGNIHDWYGMNNAGNYGLPDATVVRNVPASTNFAQFHRYGFLWTPATAMKKGTLSYYFDGVQVGATTTYSQWTNQAPPPGPKTPWTFGVLDHCHLVLIIGTGPPVPMQIKSVQVWQASAINNLHN